MKETRYYYVEVNLPLFADSDVMNEKMDGFNDKNHFLQFDSISEEGRLNFLMICHFDPIRETESDLEEEISEVFEAVPQLKQMKLSDFSFRQKQLINTARCAQQKRHIDGEQVFRWNIKTPTEILREVEKMTGFAEFKKFCRELCWYCENVYKANAKGIYNVVIIDECGVDTDIFIQMIYDLYAAEGVIKDYTLVMGDLDDAVNTKRNTSLMYVIKEQWVIGNKSSFFSIYSQMESFMILQKRSCIYITVMDKAQYYDFKNDDHFRRLFPHTVHLEDLTKEEKLEILREQACEYGFTLNKDEFYGSDLFDLPLCSLNMMAGQVTGRLQKDRELKDRILHLADFDKKEKIIKKPPLSELEEMIGLTEVKEKINEIITFLRRRGKDALPCLHMVFLGNPGTGKTTVARLLGKIFAEEGILKKKEVFIETDREGLVARYVGHTASQTSDKVEEALGGILFIDEAYALGMYGSESDFGKEAIATLVKRMEDFRKDFVCIMAGYNEEMNTMLNVNPGLKERVQFYIEFPDYSADEMYQIFQSCCREKEYVLTPEAGQKTREYLEEIVNNKDEHFANARLVRKLFERVQMQQALRTETNEINGEDIEKVFLSKDMKDLTRSKDKMPMGFVG